METPIYCANTSHIRVYEELEVQYKANGICEEWIEMPDWLAHILVAYILCCILGIKFKVFNKENTAIVMVGALIPDIVKVGLLFDF